MAAVPAGYEAFQSFRRKGVTLLCFLLASSMAIGITVYVDSYSVHEWDKSIDVGQIAIVVDGFNVESYVNGIRNVPGVIKAAGLRSGHGSIRIGYNETITFYEWGDILTPDDVFFDTFPNYIILQSGRFPQNASEIAVIDSLRMYSDIKIGDVLTINLDDTVQPATIVGFYSHEETPGSPYSWIVSSIAIVRPEVVSNDQDQTRVLVDIERSVLSPFNPTAALQYLNGIDESIRLLDPQYIPGRGWGWYVHDRISTGISSYILWVQMLRIGQMFRASSVIFLLMLLTFLAIRHNVNERRYEENMLTSRGAAKSDLEKVTTREVFILSLASCFVGIPLGLFLSRVAIAATGFFTFNPVLAFTEPILVSLDSLIISAIVTIALPMLTLGGYRAVYSTKRNVDENRGRLAKLSRGLDIIRWDILIVALSGLFLGAMLSAGSAASSNIILAIMLPFLPLPLFLGISSLSMKALKYGAIGLSKVMKRIVGEIPSSIGIRRVGKGASSAGAAAMILVFAICLSWNSAIIDASIPVTVQNQSRLSVGADLTFALDEYEYDTWNDFIANVTNHELVQSGTLVSEGDLFLSAGYEGRTNFLAVNPGDYINVGYDYLGNPLNESELASLFEILENSPDGAIITSDVAIAYEFEVGDSLRATTSLDVDAVSIDCRVIGITDALPEMPERYNNWYYPYDMVPYYYSTQVVGTDRILINRDYLGSQVILQNTTNNYYCVRTTPNANASIIVEDIFSVGGQISVYQGKWEAVSVNVHDYLNNTQYVMERSLDTMLTVLTIGAIVAGFTIYAVEGVRSRKREIALLRSIGASTRTVIITLGSEMLVLMMFSMMLLAIYAPLFLTTTINLAGGSTTGYGDVYLIPIFPVIPWGTILTVLGFFLVSVAFFIIIIAALSSRINLAYTLNASWAEAGPYGGDM